VVVVVVVVVVVIFNGHSLRIISFAFQHPSAILLATDYSHSLKMCSLDDGLDSLRAYLPYTRHTLQRADKSTACISESLDIHGR
jgi:hypothetical protein